MCNLPSLDKCQFKTIILNINILNIFTIYIIHNCICVSNTHSNPTTKMLSSTCSVVPLSTGMHGAFMTSCVVHLIDGTTIAMYFHVIETDDQTIILTHAT